MTVVCKRCSYSTGKLITIELAVDDNGKPLRGNSMLRYHYRLTKGHAHEGFDTVELYLSKFYIDFDLDQAILRVLSLQPQEALYGNNTLNFEFVTKR